jgi:tetraacyldisaccharide 4'-kinase
MQLHKPKFWGKKDLNIFAILLIPLTLIIIFSNWINFFFPKKKFKIKTICIGNIYLGGTGKTPLSIEVYKILKKLRIKSVFIKKNYFEHKDEIKLLSKVGPIISLKSRKKSIEKAQRKKFKVAIIDDGLQDRSLDYDLKILCFDKENFIGNGKLIPAGPLRENLNSIKKYDIVFLNGLKKNNKNIILKLNEKNNKLKIFETHPIITNLKKIKKNKNYLIFSGIGNPDSFRKLLKKNNLKISKSISYPDHYEYSKSDIYFIKNQAKTLKSKILTTEKDYLRIKKEYRSGINFIKIKLDIDKKKRFIELLKN